MNASTYGRKGIGLLWVYAEHPERVVASADQYAVCDHKARIVLQSDDEVGQELADGVDPRMLRKFGNATLIKHRNAYVNTGLNNSLDREFGIGGTAIGFIGVANNTTAVTATSTFINGASGGAAANTIILAISPAASRTSQTTTAGATFVNGSFTAGVFVWNKIGLFTTSTDAGTGLVDVIGGTAGVSPYNRTFSLDLTAAGTFSVVAQIAVTAVAV